ncbi:MAG: hypothetical protein J7L71_07850 [Spirochaetaceae bacterium]|nr:hypothetical protein [Spirochaetaceae bacterium]
MGNKTLKREYTELQKQLSQIGYICNGTVMSAYRKCGKPSCSCKDDPQMQHGPYHIWTRKEKGKTVTRSLSEKQSEHCSDYMQNFKEMENIIEKMKKISIQIIEESKND